MRVDIVSMENINCQKSWNTPDQVVFSGIGKTVEEIEYILSSDNVIKSFNVESIDELELIQSLSKSTEKNSFAFDSTRE